MLVSLKDTITFGSQLSVANTFGAVGGKAPQVMTMSVGTLLMTGGVVSSTVITCSAKAELPQSSVAIQVLDMVYPSEQEDGIIISSYTISTLLSQLSVAATLFVNTGTSLHS